MSSLKDWKDRWYWMTIPADFPLPRNFVAVRSHMDDIVINQGDNREDEAFSWLDSIVST